MPILGGTVGYQILKAGWPGGGREMPETQPALGSVEPRAVDTRLRLAFVIDVIQDWQAGGTEQQIVQLLNRLDSRHFEPVIFVLQASKALQNKPVKCPVLLVGSAENAKASRVRTLLDLTRALR